MALEKHYNHKEVEPRIAKLWEQSDYFTAKINPAKKPFSIFLTPPNASGQMHIGNALMIAIQDILARYSRARGYSTLWIPSTDHGGYETQVTFEKELEKIGRDKSGYTQKELFEVIGKFVEGNNDLIKNQIRALGASVDWSRFRFTMDAKALESVRQTFTKMVSDNLIYRRPYMVYYCPKCSTILSDIELKEKQEVMPLYFIKFNFEDGSDYLSLATTRPEFIFATTHVLINPNDERYAQHIGKNLNNPINGKPVKIVASKRKFDPKNPELFLSPFSPSFKKYDYEYTLRNDIPAQNLVDWNGKLIEQYPGLSPIEARTVAISYLKEKSSIEKIDDSYQDSVLLCKRGHNVESVIMLTWFLKFDDERIPLRQNASEAVNKEGLGVIPKWREKGLMEWLGKMPDWPIARQNVWGIKIPIWYEISDTSQFLVWFRDKVGNRKNGNLKILLDGGLSFQDLENGLERIYASESVKWTLIKESGKKYLPETDTFDTWFSSGQWATIVFDNGNEKELSYFYPSHSIVIGQDLLRLSVVRKIVLSHYLSGRLPFKIVYLNRLIKGADGQKMSKSLGNAVPLEYYLEKFGADITRMALISYTNLQEDFIFTEEQLSLFQNFARKLWRMGKIVDIANQYSLNSLEPENLSVEDKKLLKDIDSLIFPVSSFIEKYLFAQAQKKVCSFIEQFEQYTKYMESQKNIVTSLAIFKNVFKKYLILLHPFMPFMTEELYIKLYDQKTALASEIWPK